MLRVALLFLMLCACGAPPKPTPKGDGESCSKPFKLMDRSLSFFGTTAGFSDDEAQERSPCGGAAAPDVVFEIPSAIGSLVTVTVKPESSAFQPIVKVRGADQGCVAMDDACDSATGKGQTAEVVDWAPALGGVQFIIVDGAAMTSGAFTLTVSQR